VSKCDQKTACQPAIVHIISDTLVNGASRLNVTGYEGHMGGKVAQVTLSAQP